MSYKFQDKTIVPDMQIDMQNVQTLFATASTFNINDIANFTSQSNLSYNVTNKNGQTLLHVIIGLDDLNKKEHQRLNLVRFFVQNNVDIDAPFYANQIEVVTNIAKALPADCKLFVKEHPLMRYRHWREITEYEEMISLPNVEVIHPEVSAKEILENCLAVITIAGSGGLEAALHKKPAIVFADTIYASLPSVYRLKNLEELPNLIREALDTEVKLTDINKFINILERNSFDFDITGHYTKILEKFHSGGFMISNQISMKELEEFIEEDKKVYELLADEHLKKIEQYANFKN